MKPKPVILRELADRDIHAALAFYGDAGGADAAASFLDQLEQTLERIGRHPAAGSPRYEAELTIPGLRTALLHAFPHVVFYRDATDHVDVWRILHAHRDIPETLRLVD